MPRKEGQPEEEVDQDDEQGNEVDIVRAQWLRAFFNKSTKAAGLVLLGYTIWSSDQAQPTRKQISEYTGKAAKYSRKGLSSFKEGLPTDPGWKNMPVTDAMAGWSPRDPEWRKNHEQPRDLTEGVKPPQETVAAMGGEKNYGYGNKMQGVAEQSGNSSGSRAGTKDGDILERQEYLPIDCNRIVNKLPESNIPNGLVRCIVVTYKDGRQQLQIIDGRGRILHDKPWK